MICEGGARGGGSLSGGNASRRLLGLGRFVGLSRLGDLGVTWLRLSCAFPGSICRRRSCKAELCVGGGRGELRPGCLVYRSRA